MTIPRVSVIVPVWNRPGDIRRCVASLLDQTLQRADYEVIVVDNGSTDDTRAAAAAPGVIVLDEPQPGSYVARNRGLAVARAPLVAFIDSDCTADRDWLAAALRAHAAEPDAGIISGRIELEGTGGGAADQYERLFAFNQQKSAAGGRATTANWLSPAAILRELGGFRADLKSGGDFELAGRIVASGRRIAYAADMLVLHPARATLAQLVGKRRRVVGGALADSRGSGDLAFRMARTSAYRLRDLARDRTLAPATKLQVGGIIVLLLATSWGETARLALGGKPRRA